MAITAKEEYIEDQVTKLVKREDDSWVRQSRFSPTPIFFFPQPYPYFPPQMPWFGNMMGMPFMPPPMFGMNPMTSTMPFQPSRKKPFKIVKEITKIQISIPEMTGDSPVKTEATETEMDLKRMKKRKEGKRRPRASACKNYIGLLCAGFSRAVLGAEKSSPMIKFLLELAASKKESFEECEGTEGVEPEQLVETFKVFVQKSICGKRIKKSNGDRDFKIRNSMELHDLLLVQPEDTKSIQVRKEILRETFNYFFDSEYYEEWLVKGMISESNKVFFQINKEEIYKKFLNPLYYKPKFNHDHLTRKPELSTLSIE